MSLLRRAGLRHFRRHPGQLGLAVLGVALGVAVVVSIDLANGSALAAFELSSRSITGRASHQIVGGSVGVPEEVYRRLRLELGVRSAAPVVEGRVRPRSRPDVELTLLGVDPFAEAELRPDLAPAAAGGDLAAWMTRPGAVTLSRQTGGELGLAPGVAFDAEVGGRIRRLEVVGWLAEGGEGARDVLVADVATAQSLLALEGLLSRIDLALGEDAARAREIAGALPSGLRLVPASERTATAREMTRAFRLNLRALSLLALLCGAFLIYNTITFAVVQRRALFGSLRALGVTRRELAAAILTETAAIAVAGTGLGLAAGVLLGRGLVARVAQTIDDLYFALQVREVTVAAGDLLPGALLGLAVSLLAALGPAAEALGSQPTTALARSLLERRVHRALPAVTAAGLLLGGAGWLLLRFPGAGIGLAFGGLFAVLLGFALLTPAATLLLIRALAPLAGLAFGVLGRLAARGVGAALSRTGVAIAALVMAVAVTVGVDLMIRSFRDTVERWLEISLPADLYVSTGGRAASRWSGAVGLEPRAADDLARLPGIERVNAVRQAEVEAPQGVTRLVAYDLDERGRRAIEVLEGDPEAAWRAVDRGAVMVSEPLAFRRRLRIGDRVELETFDGRRSLEVAGIYTDYASEQGTVLLDLDAYRRLWRDERLTALSLYATPGTDLERLRREVRAALGDRRVRVRSNRELRRDSLVVFDRTFVVTGVLRTLAVLVAFVGVLSSFTALQLERERELAVLRACGLTRGQLWTLVTSQTGLMGLVAGLLSIPTGVAMAAIMVYVINRRSFGWSLDLAIDAGPLAAAVGLALGAAMLAGLYPAWKMARTEPAAALRGE